MDEVGGILFGLSKAYIFWIGCTGMGTGTPAKYTHHGLNHERPSKFKDIDTGIQIFHIISTILRILPAGLHLKRVP